MDSAVFTDTELQLTTERRQKYRGTAKINLDQIAFHTSQTPEVDPKNVERLCQIFRKDGCHRLDVRNHITAVVSKRQLKRACHAARVTAEELLTNPPDQYPYLNFSTEVLCLHGQHRIKAGEEVLSPSEQWWTVDLYLDDISHDLRNTLVDEYTNEKQPSDGEVYRKLRQYQHEHNARFQKRWWSRLSENKAKRLRQLTYNVDVCSAFDALLPIPGLWNGMSLGSLNRVLALKCDEEIVQYLTHVKNFWSTLVNHNRNQMAKIDQHTVDTLQLRAPTISQTDAKAVKGLILSGEVFAHFSESERSAIWERMQSSGPCAYIIPSLYTFFRDVLYLEACAHSVRRLVILSKEHPTIRTAMRYIFKQSRSGKRRLVQTSETTFRRHAGTGAECFGLGYRQIWLYAMRHYPDMPKDPTRKDIVAKANRRKADKAVIYDMAALARRLGFRSPQIKELLSRSPDREIAREALLKARKPCRYQYDNIESLIDYIEKCFATARANESLPSCESVVNRPLRLECRCGPPSEQSQLLDRPYLFLDRLHSGEVSARTTVSSLSVRQCVYFAFFGKPSSFGQRQTQFVPSPSDAFPTDVSPSPLFVPDDDSLPGGPREQHAGHRRSIDAPQNNRRFRKEARRERRRKKREALSQQRRSEHPSEHQLPFCGVNFPAISEDTDMGRPQRGDASVDQEVLMGSSSVDHFPVDEDIVMAAPSPRNTSIDEDSSMRSALVDHSLASEDTAMFGPLDADDAPLDPGNTDPSRENYEVELLQDAKQAAREPFPHRAEDLRTAATAVQKQPQIEANEPKQLQPEAEDIVDTATQETVLSQHGGSDGGGQEPRQSEQAQRITDAETVCQSIAEERAAAGCALEGQQQEHREAEERAAVERAEQERLAQEAERAEQERLAWEAERAEQERLAREAEKRAAVERAEQERLARQAERAEQERLAQEAERAEQERLAREAEEEAAAAERAVQETLQQLQSEADGRAIGQSAVEEPRAEPGADGRTAAQASEPIPGLVEEAAFSATTFQDSSGAVGTGGPEDQSLAAQSVPANVTRQGRVTRDARTAKTATRIDLTPLVSNATAGHEEEPNPSRRERAITPRPGSAEVETSRPDTEAMTGPSQTGDDSKQKKVCSSVAIGSESAPQTLGEVIVPRLPAHHQPHRALPPNAVTITFKAYKQGKWHVTDQIPVDPADPSEAVRVAYKYARERNQDARFYNHALRKVSVMQCVRAAIDDRTNTVLMSLGEDLVVTRKKVADVTQMLKADAEKVADDSDDSIL